MSETFISSDDVFDPTIKGFDFEPKIRSNGDAGGGVGTHIKNGIPYTRRVDLETDDLEIIWLEINFKIVNRLLLEYYIAPDSSKYSNKKFLKSLTDVLNRLSYEDKETILMGDINCDYLKDSDHREIKNLFVSYGYKQLIEKATRIIETSETLINVILTNSPETIRNYDTILSSNGDHDIIAVIRKISTPKYPPRTIYSRNYKNYNTNVIKNELRNVNWEHVTNCGDSNICWQYIKDILLKCADTHTPLTKKTIKGKPCPWLTEEIKKQMNDCDGLLRKARRSNWMDTV